MINNYKCNFFFFPTDLNSADTATRKSRPKETRQELWWHNPSLRVLEELKTTHQDFSELLENAASNPRNLEERIEGIQRTRSPLETNTQQIGSYTSRLGSPEATLNTDHTQRSNRITS